MNSRVVLYAVGVALAFIVGAGAGSRACQEQLSSSTTHPRGVSLVVLENGVECAIYGRGRRGGIDCDWRQRQGRGHE